MQTILFFGLLLGAAINLFGTPEVSLLPAPEGGIQPQAVKDEDGTVHLIFYKGDAQAGDIFYARRRRGEKVFGRSMRVNSQSGSAMAIGSIRGAQLAVGQNGRAHVVWNGMGKGARPVTFEGKSAAPLLYTRMNDAGTAFEPERNLISSAYGLDGGSSVAADQSGHVYVMWHAATPGSPDGETHRAIFLRKSSDEGSTFAEERPALRRTTGACGCCGMRAFADEQGRVFALYRAAASLTNRAETLLVSRDHGGVFAAAYSRDWNIASCPMSSASLSTGPAGLLAAGESEGKVFFVNFDAATRNVSAPSSPERKGKHPVVLTNRKGIVLLTWIEGSGWARGGTIAWQAYPPDGEKIGATGSGEKVPAWDLLSGFVDEDDSFTIIF